MMALSPGGERVAYTSRNGEDLSLVIMSLEYLGIKKTVKVEPERDPNLPDESQPPPQLRFLRWSTPNRLVYALTERVVPLPPVVGPNGAPIPNPDGPAIVSPIMATDADGRQRGTVIDARHFQETPAEARKSLADLLRTTKELQSTRAEAVRWRMPHLDILGFLPRDRDQLIVGTHGAYSVPMQHLVDIRTGNVREFGSDWPSPPGEPHVFDWFRLKVVGEQKNAAHPTIAWQDEELGRVQRELTAKFPRRVVEILDWSETRTRVLVRVTGGSDAGRVFVYQRTEDLVLEILQRAPWLSAARLNLSRFFECDAPDGARLSGYVTWPSKPRQSPSPLLVVFPSGFPGKAQPPFDPEAQVFADRGFVVVRLNHRCVAGMRNEDLNPLRAAVDRVSVDDARTALDAIATRNPNRPFDRKRVATLGRGFGGYLALRAIQLEPVAFRCAIALNAPVELRSWLHPPTAPATKAGHDIPVALIDHAGAEWKNLSVVDQAEILTNPALLLIEPGRNPTIDASTADLREKLKGPGRACEYAELEPGFAAAQPAPRAAVYRKMEEFLNLHLYGYGVKIGPAKEVQ